MPTAATRIKTKTEHRNRGSQSYDSLNDACRRYSTSVSFTDEISFADQIRLLDITETCQQAACVAYCGIDETPPEQRVYLRFAIELDTWGNSSNPTVLLTHVSFPCDADLIPNGSTPVSALAKSLRLKAESLLRLSRQLEGEVKA